MRKPLFARVTRVLSLSLLRLSFVDCCSFILFIFIFDNLITITEFIKFLLLSFDQSLHFPFDSDGRCCFLCSKFSSRQNSSLLDVAVFLFYPNRFVIHFDCNRMTKSYKYPTLLETMSKTHASAILAYIAKIAV